MGHIYKITNLINGKIYVGKTIKSIQERFKEHIKKASQHPNRYLYDAMNHYGCENFFIESIEECEDTFLDEREIFWIKKLNATNPQIGYNLTNGGEGGNTWLLNPHKNKTGEKIRKSNLKDRYVPITRESLQEDMNNNLTYKDMMQKYHCSQTTLANRFRYFFNGKSLKELRPVINSGQFKKIDIPEKEFLKDIKEGILTNKEICTKYNIGEGTFFNRCKTFTGMTPNQYRQKSPVKEGAPKIEIPKDELLSLIKKGKKLEEIAKYFNVSKNTIVRRIKEYFNETITGVRRTYLCQTKKILDSQPTQ